MTDKQIIETLRNIKEHCEKQGCDSCGFNTWQGCQIKLVARDELNKIPAYWGMEEIEKIINEAD